jgi:hypothetical protein
LNNFTRAPEYIAYLAYILTSLAQEQDQIRTIAGYLLKNNARLILRSPPQVGAYVKTAILQAFSDPSPMIRSAASQAIVSFLGILEPKNWPECLQHLFNLLESPNLDQQEVSLDFALRGSSTTRESNGGVIPHLSHSIYSVWNKFPTRLDIVVGWQPYEPTLTDTLIFRLHLMFWKKLVKIIHGN